MDQNLYHGSQLHLLVATVRVCVGALLAGCSRRHAPVRITIPCSVTAPFVIADKYPGGHRKQGSQLIPVHPYRLGHGSQQAATLMVCVSEKSACNNTRWQRSFKGFLYLLPGLARHSRTTWERRHRPTRLRHSHSARRSCPAAVRHIRQIAVMRTPAV